MSVRKFSIGDSDDDDIESEPSTASRFGLLRIRDDIEEEENKQNVEEMSTSAVMSSTSLLKENPEVESLDSGEILADRRIKPEINEDPESEEFQPKKRTASPTFDPLLPGPSGHVQSACADILSDMKCFMRMEPIEEQKNDKKERNLLQKTMCPVETERWTSSSSCSSFSSEHSSFERIEPVKEDVKNFLHVKKSETERWNSSSSCSSFSSNHSSFERIETGKEDVKKFLHVKKSRKRKNKCSSSVLQSATISSSMRNISEASSIHDPKKIKLEEIAPGYDLPGTSISSSRSCESIETDVKGLEEPKSVEKTESDEESLEELESGRKQDLIYPALVFYLQVLVKKPE
ncbi:hypothetical protein CEXT_379951 [Caerostris extrusa]|uniref:Uncharacterized protein n=1 Tax=Caerostris extrusa TaxID=172846 RepID=A0AAV4VHL8_CAEEX|nr:hypothetical protein CEXT_379951 [Caerostris extrusa]